MYALPNRVRDVVGARGGGIRGFGEGPGYFFGDEGGIVLIGPEAEEQGRQGFRGEKVVKERLCYLGQVRGP